MHCLTPHCCLSHSDTRVNAPGTRALSGRVHSAGPAHVHSWVAIKSPQRDPWDMDERRRKREEEGGFVAKGFLKSVALHCLVALNTLPSQTAGLRSFFRCAACSLSEIFLIRLFSALRNLNACPVTALVKAIF